MDQQRSWTAVWVRVLVVLLALGVLLVAVPLASILLFAGVGSVTCLGSACGVATIAAVGGGLLGYAAGLATLVCAIVFAVRPRVGILVAALVCAVLVPVSAAAQVFGDRALSDGRVIGREAMKLSFDVQTVMEKAVLEVTGVTIRTSSDLLGPYTDVAACANPPGGGTGYVANSTLSFLRTGPYGQDIQKAISDRVQNTASGAMGLPPGVAVSASWTATPDTWDLTVATNCQPLPKG